MDRELQEKILREWKEQTGKDYFIQSEDGTVVASTCSVRGKFLRDAVSGGLLPEVLGEQAARAGMSFEGGRVLLLLEGSEISAGILEEVAQAIFEEALEPDSCVSDHLGRYLLLLIPGLLDDLEEAADSLRGSLEVETVSRVRVGVSRSFTSPAELPAAWRQAEAALKSLSRFPQIRQVAVYEKLGLKLAAMQMPPESADVFLAGFPGDLETLFADEELLRTAEVFLANGLNSAETARQLIVHRNTLVYRLDKIQRISGLDLKRFEDAAAFRFAALLWQYRRDAADRKIN